MRYLPTAASWLALAGATQSAQTPGGQGQLPTLPLTARRARARGRSGQPHVHAELNDADAETSTWSGIRPGPVAEGVAPVQMWSAWVAAVEKLLAWLADQGRVT